MKWKIWWKKNIKENIKENIIIFSLLLSLKNNEENKRKKIKKKVEKILSGCYRLHRNQRSTLELVSRCRKHRWQRPWRGGRRRRPSARREDNDSGLNTAQKAELAGLLEESCSTLGEGDLQGPFLLDFFDFYLLFSHALFVRRLEKVTSKDPFFSIFLISIFCLPMLCFFTIFVFVEDMLCFFTLCLP